MNHECPGCRWRGVLGFLLMSTWGPRTGGGGVRWLRRGLESGGQGAPGLELRPLWNQARGQRDQWPSLMHVLAVAEGPSRLPSWVLGEGVRVGGPETGLRGQPAPTVRGLRPQKGRPGRNPGLMFAGDVIPALASCPPPLCPAASRPQRWSHSDLNAFLQREMTSAWQRPPHPGLHPGPRCLKPPAGSLVS